jgi:outer membrane protein OmpA-like peptidoglycan-associated protein
MRRFCTILATLLLTVAAPAPAQKPGTVEAGLFGRYTWLESDLNFADDVGIGARLGVFVVQNLQVEADASYTRTEGPAGEKINYIPMHARLLYNLPWGEHAAVLLGAGYTRNTFRKAYDESASGFGGLLGLRLGTGDRFSIRLDLTGDYIGDPENKNTPPPLAGVKRGDSNFHLGAQAGISLMLGGKRDGDRDGDGVKDSMDACPTTPAGDAVDATGCSLPKDADRDGVLDTMDQCPSTPAGDQVDARGCSLPKDADRDGVVDSADRCPATPAGDAVDANGCSLPKDADNDGVVDAADRCPNTPAGTPVDANGCPRDSDGDGVVDRDDRCPDTPAGAAVDQFGCRTDSDGDGVMDTADRCPNTPAGTKVDRVGCAEIFEAGRPLVLKGVNFETGRATLLPESQAVLDTVATSLINNPDVNVEIGGHTDNTGSRATNLRLSQARADAVKAYLVSKGINAIRMTTRGYGPDNPTADNATADGRAANRRVELSKTN